MITFPEGVTSLADYIETVLTKYANKPAYTALGQTLTFKEIDEKASALARFLCMKQNCLLEIELRYSCPT